MNKITTTDHQMSKRLSGQAFEEQMRSRGYLRLGEAALRIGRPPQFIHRAIKLPRGGNNGPRLLNTTSPPEWIRAGYLYFIYEPALRRLVGEDAARILKLRTEEDVRAGRRATA